MDDYWKKCNGCKKSISFLQTYYVCNVSTCTRKRTGYVFCGVSCWDAHLPLMNHREAWAVEKKSPSKELWRQVLAGNREDMTFAKDPSANQKDEPQSSEALIPPVLAKRTLETSAPKTILRKKPL